MVELTCFRCGRTPDKISEYIALAKDSGTTPDEFVRRDEGTFNSETNHFCCTDCYIAIDMPTAPGRGWKAP